MVHKRDLLPIQVMSPADDLVLVEVSSILWLILVHMKSLFEEFMAIDLVL